MSDGMQTKPKKDLRGLSPYLKRYPTGIVFGLLCVLLMGVLGILIPLATGVITDTLRGDPVPFQHTTEQSAGQAKSASVSDHSLSSPWLSRIIPYYEPSSRRTLAIYCIFIVVCILIKGLLSFYARWVLNLIFATIC